jgi:hypothetical protein
MKCSRHAGPLAVAAGSPLRVRLTPSAMVTMAAADAGEPGGRPHE